MNNLKHNTKRFWMILLSVSLGLLAFPLLIFGANLMANDGLEPPFIPYNTWNGWNLQVAHDWEKFIIEQDFSGSGNSKLYFFSSCDWRDYNNGPVCEKRDGADAQVWWSSRTFDAGIYQQVSGLNIGEDYGFQAGILQVWERTTSQTDGKMFRSVGIDPYGGISPTSTNVIWSPEENQDVDWFYPGVGATAMSDTVTVFIRVRSPDDATTPHSNQVWVDDTFFDLGPTTELTLNADSDTQVTASWQGTPRSGFHLYTYEAQYRKVSDSTWTDLLIFDSDSDPDPNTTNATFTVEVGESYIVRARTWHEQDGGDSHEVPGPWVEAEYPLPISIYGTVAGNVLHNQAGIVSGATIQVVQAITSTDSQSDGSYTLPTGHGTFGLTATHSSGWTAPQPIQVTVAGSGTMQSTALVSITLRPPDDFITNGDFEGNLDNWTHTLATPTFVNQAYRSGDYSLCITETGSLTQVGSVTDMYQPVLSFWYKAEGGEGNNSLTARVFGIPELNATAPVTIMSTNNGWHYAYIPLDLNGSFEGTGTFSGTVDFNTKSYSGYIGVEFISNQQGSTPTAFCLDEVSVGRSWGGAFKLFLPFVLK